MSIFSLPKELRLQIWSLAYFASPPRLVTLRTSPHNEQHTESTFCPRYSPTPAPTVFNICRESRAEAEYEARRHRHLISLPSPLASEPQGFYFRLDTDVLFIDLEAGNKHFDDSPDAGLLAHFLEAGGCDADALRKIAITQIVRVAFVDGALSNCLRDFPNIAYLVMVLDLRDMRSVQEKERFVLAARRIVTQYRLDMRIRAKARGEVYVHDEKRLDLDFALRKDGELEVLNKSVWEGWGELERGWWKEDVPQRYIDFNF
ncbi:uncharacterized protein M421DRAFT_3890 [Didymella exigua CBS 183.55]|uniref:2EXR domain-containing protein n=1 Tax=Didymella exigua CBS 183.55 TaxID=1150837 RepID=A0A6A5RT28_9PLEO|nr:uncharacterized protein M421DRAFT_3890 [Didymella exigua CBS 183.55]KAF1930138.1 hypothetical protein M421DRAFT_3890 [Didymella exigua CBS 183.55]